MLASSARLHTNDCNGLAVGCFACKIVSILLLPTAPSSEPLVRVTSNRYQGPATDKWWCCHEHRDGTVLGSFWDDDPEWQRFFGSKHLGIH